MDAEFYGRRRPVVLNAGKESYDNIVIPDDKLLAAIENGINREKNSGKKGFSIGMWLRRVF